MKYAIVAFLLLSQVACTTDTNSYTLSGSADGLADGSKVIIYSLKDNRTNVIDTLFIKSGSFSGSFTKTAEPSMYFMVVNNSSIPYFPESEDLKATIYKDSIQASFVTGNLQNDSYREFAINSRKVTKLRTEISDSYRAAKKVNDGVLIKKLQQQNVIVTKNEVAFKKNFAKENPNSIFALLLIFIPIPYRLVFVTVIFLNVIFSRLSIRNPPKIVVVSFPVPTNVILLRVILSVVVQIDILDIIS